MPRYSEEFKEQAVSRLMPANAFSPAERAEIVRISNWSQYGSLTPSQNVPCLSDEGRHLDSEFSYYQVLRANNGGPMKGATMLTTLERLGVVLSFSRPSVSDDNPYSESLFRTLKYRPTYPRVSIEAARRCVYDFVLWYNHEHHHSAIQYVTPAQRHGGIDEALLQQPHKAV